MNSKFKCSFTLKQHTPLIHFQHFQEDATLRATELKPKLDRFLIRLFESNHIDIKPLLIGKGDKKALDYKVNIKNPIYYDEDVINSVVAMEEPKKRNGKIQYKEKRGQAVRFNNGKRIPKVNQFPMFFGNMMEDGSDEMDIKKFTICEEVEVHFFSFHTQITKAIEENFSAFLMQTNFGTRQSKGFGSFYIADEKPIQTKYWFDLNLESLIEDNNNVREHEQEFKRYYYLFETIEYFYKALRSGINAKRGRRTTFYFKSLMFLYGKDRLNAQWDKKSIKENFYRGDRDYQRQKRDHRDPKGPVQYSSRKAFLLRDLFGLSTDQQWMSYRDSISKESVKKDKGQPKYARMKSPITFKPIRISRNVFHVYFDWNQEVLNEVLGEEFKINSRAARRSMRLSFPNQFSFDDFFEYIFNPKNLDLYEHVEEEYQDTDEFYIIEDIFYAIRKNLGYDVE